MMNKIMCLLGLLLIMASCSPEEKVKRKRAKDGPKVMINDTLNFIENDNNKFNYQGWQQVTGKTFSFKYPPKTDVFYKHLTDGNIFSVKRGEGKIPDFEMIEFRIDMPVLTVATAEVNEMIKGRFGLDANAFMNVNFDFKGIPAKRMKMELSEGFGRDKEKIYANAYVLIANKYAYIFIAYKPQEDLKGYDKVFNYIINSVRLS